MEEENKYKRIFDSFMSTIPKSISRYGPQSPKITIPLITNQDIVDICTKAMGIFRDEQSLLAVNGHWFVVGDIHGHLLDLFYILQTFGVPPKRNYLFLGDLVDRGEFGIEAVIIVFLMKILWPQSVNLIRGNHEFYYQCSQGGFTDQVVSEYNDPSLVDMFMTVFNYIPLGALVNRKYICVHGGIGPDVTLLKSIADVQRPVCDMGNDVVDSLTWSDPNTEISGFQSSNRGLGFLFGADTCEEFHRKNSTSIIIRGHECVMNGFEEHFNHQIITVFSASNYCGLMENKGAVMEIRDSFSYSIKTWEPLPYISRNDVTFCRHKMASFGRKVKATQSSKVLPFYEDILKNQGVSQSRAEAKLTIPQRSSGGKPAIATTIHVTKKLTRNLSLNGKQFDPLFFP